MDKTKIMPEQVYITGVGMTRFGRSEQPLEELICQAGRQAIQEGGLAEVDAIYIGVMNAEEFTGQSNLAALLADDLGFPGVPSSRVETASSTGAGVFASAFFSVASGYMRNVLVLAGEKMTHLPTKVTTRILAEVIDRNERRYGASMPALAAMITQKYRHDHALTKRHMQDILAAVAMKNHRNGASNPYAQFQKPITREKYLESK
ncbi:MAG: thiolase family protein, partial [Deltaproteobacteria bacterium]|nr:thiolase family protein [Deltaproteobacteria bacterium]